MRNTQLIVNINSIESNIRKIKEYLPDTKIMPIVKANGYGTFLNHCPDILNEFEYVGVALLDEAIELRKNGYKNKVLILYPLSQDEFEESKRYDFILNGSNILDICDSKREVQVHTEIETGMGRTGIQEKDIDKYIINLKKHKNIKIDGLFTHLSTNSDEKFSLKQIDLFNKSIEEFKSNGINPNNIHLSSSRGLKYHNPNLYSMVRIGLLIYGYYPNNNLKGILDLEPSMVLKSNISYLKTIEKGDTVGYNQNFIAEKKTNVATIPFGFADGLLTLETGEPYVIVNGQKAKIIGICMDNMMLDVTNIEDVKIGQEVYIWDNDKLNIDEVGKWCNGICNYEVMSSISTRVPRVLRR